MVQVASLLSLSAQRVGFSSLLLATEVETASSQEKEKSLDDEAAQFLQEVDRNMSSLEVITGAANWNWATNITKANEHAKTRAFLKLVVFSQSAGKYAYENFDPSKIYDEKTKRALREVQESRPVLSQSDLKRYMQLGNQMVGIYSKATVCPANMSEDCSAKNRLKLEPHLVELMKKSRNAEELEVMWKRWRDSAGRPIRKIFFEHSNYSTLYANRMGYKSFTDNLLKTYERDEPNFRQSLSTTFLEILPFYEDLHAYVRSKLSKFYGSEVVAENGTIPAHILGNMWAQEWSNIYDLVKPHPDEAKAEHSVTEMMQKLNWTVFDIFKAAENFFVSIGLRRLPEKFWEKSLFTQPKDRDVVCHASAWDMGGENDVRIKMCTEVNNEYLGVVHHELGHLYYYLAYQNQSTFFRGGANPGFHEAVGDTIFLSSSQDSYLKYLGLLPAYFQRTAKTKINLLMRKALFALAFIPYSYAIEQWRWDIYDGKIAESNCNSKWWDYRKKYQGLHSPVPRSEKDFDAGSKFHVASSTPYLRYFVARFLQYQFHDELCQKPGKKVDISTCSIFGNKNAGEIFWEMLKLGKSEPWPIALESVIGSKKMSASSMLKFYEPLRNWLRAENTISGVCLGWGQDWPKEAHLNGPRC